MTQQKISATTLATAIGANDRFPLWDSASGLWRAVKLALLQTSYPSVTLDDLPSGGAIGTAAATVDIAAVIIINQTTSAKLITLPTPTNTAVAKKVTLVAGSTARLWTAYKRVILPGMSASFTYVPSVGWKADDVGVQVMFQSGAAQAYPADTNANDITLGTIPGGFLGANDAVQYKYVIDNTSGSSNKTVRVKFGGQLVVNASSLMAGATSTFANDKTVQNANSTTGQTVSYQASGTDVSLTSTGGASGALTVDTSIDVACAIGVQKTTGADVTTLRRYEVIYHPAP